MTAFTTLSGPSGHGTGGAVNAARLWFMIVALALCFVAVCHALPVVEDGVNVYPIVDDSQLDRRGVPLDNVGPRTPTPTVNHINTIPPTNTDTALAPRVLVGVGASHASTGAVSSSHPYSPSRTYHRTKSTKTKASSTTKTSTLTSSSSSSSKKTTTTTTTSIQSAVGPVISNTCKSCGFSWNGGHQDFLGAHNALRALYNLPAFSTCQGIINDAQASANKIATTQCGSLSHDIVDLNAKGEGENLYASWGAEESLYMALLSWNSEAADYFTLSNNGANPAAAGSNNAGKQVMHFTQLVWAGSRYVGCASAKCDSGGGSMMAGNMFDFNGLTDPFKSPASPGVVCA
ncbi:hypothetical protein HDU76_001028 [Blyttiomyces sp. JEL0837]|nr:hypothetical protein HDU76_001028 [Blyttiomyces sp. JEL0837]